MRFLRWFFGGERYRINLGLLGGGAVGVTASGWANPLLGIALFAPICLWWVTRYRRWVASGGDISDAPHRSWMADDLD